MPGGVHPPPQVIATWPKPNYVDPETEGSALMVVGIVLTCITGLLVLARIYSRCFITRAPGLDDVLIVLSLAFSIALTVMVTLAYKNLGYGRHVWDVPPAWGPDQRLNIWICEFLYIPATCLAKISVMLFYRRLSTTFSKTFEVATWVGIAFNVAYFLGFIGYIGGQCTPYDAYWLQLSPTFVKTTKFHCANEHVSLPVSAALSVVGDFYATALPLLLVRGLDLPRGQKTALYVLFGFGALVIAAGTVRTVLLNYLINETYDSTWWLWKMWLWTFVEVNVSIMAASAPALKPFFRRYLVDKVLSGGSRNRGKYAYGSGGQRISEALGGGGGGQQGEGKKLWSNASSTVRDDGYDVEKIGTAVSSPDGTRKYELKALPSGRIHPVMVNAVEMGYGSGGEEVLPMMTRRSSNAIHNEEEAARPAWVLPTLGAGEEGGRDGLRSFRAEIEALPSVPVGVGRKGCGSGSGSGSRKGSQRGGKMEERPGSKSGRVLVQGQQQQVVTRHANHETKPRSAGRAAARGRLGWDLSGDEGLDSHSHNHGHSNGGGSQRLERRASQGSVKVARMRAESLKKEAAVAASARRAAERVREKGRSGSLEWDGEGWAHGGGGGGGNASGSGGGGSSSETLQLPRQGSVVFHEEGGRGSRQRDRESEEERRRRRHDTASLHLPRQGARTGDFGGEDGEDYGDGDGDTGGEEEEWDRRSVGVAV